MGKGTVQKLLVVVTLFSSMVGVGVGVAGPVGDLKSDETLVFFNSHAWLDMPSQQWHIPIHGWVYEPADSKFRKATIAQSLETLYGLQVTEDNQHNFDRRVNLLLADNERSKSIVIRLANRTYAISPSQPNGHFKHTIRVDASILQDQNIMQSLSYQAVLKTGDERVFTGRVNLVKPQGWSIISDIDDTIKLSLVTDKGQLMKHTFYLDFQAVPGMSERYQQWFQKPNMALHWVSSSPWQLYPVLEEFIQKEGFPSAEFNLKPVRFRDSTLMNLFKAGTTTKPPVIAAIINRYPERQFILVGDSGEQDPEVYAQINQQFPEQVKHILIRNVTDERANNRRFRQLIIPNNAEKWQLFTHPEHIQLDF